jgi:hypothetical protein
MAQGGAFDGASIYGGVVLGMLLLLVAWILTALNRFLTADVHENLTMTAARVLTVVAGIVITLSLVRGAMIGPGFTDRMRLGMLVAAGLITAALV